MGYGFAEHVWLDSLSVPGNGRCRGQRAALVRQITMNSVIGSFCLRDCDVSLLTLWFVGDGCFRHHLLLPGDVAQEILLARAPRRRRSPRLRSALGLDLPPLERYPVLARRADDRRSRPVAGQRPAGRHLIGERLSNSLVLAAVTAAVSVPVALLIGITSAMLRAARSTTAWSAAARSSWCRCRNSWSPRWRCWSSPSICAGCRRCSQAQRHRRLLDLMRGFAMPIVTLSCVIVAQMARMTRAALIDTLSAPYVEMARAEGRAARAAIVLTHALPNAIGPIANAVALSLSFLLGGVIIVETIFNYPGIAKLMVDGVATRDLPLVQACAMIFCAAYLLLVTLADIAAILSNPRLRHQ